ncbi:MAG: acyltransferase family protein [Bdellovibrionia bacterium]
MEISQTARTQTKSFLGYVEGLRGACALYVTLTHAFWEVWYARSPESLGPGILGWLLQAFNYGHFAVGFFIVISGFCMFRKRGEEKFPVLAGGALSYAKRRVRRIVPPYYAALALYLAIIYFTPSLQVPTGRRWDSALPAFDQGMVISHLTILHLFSKRWLFGIDPPMWSIGIEWWCYWIAPLIVLPPWKKWGPWVAVPLAFAYSAALISGDVLESDACPWYLGLFVLGMLAAQLESRKSKIPWIALSIVFAAGAVHLHQMDAYLAWADLFVGASAFSLLIGCATGESLIKAVLDTSVMRGLGRFSYSLYLCHWLILTLVHELCVRMKFPVTQELCVTVGIGVPLSVGLSYIFYLLFEKPFLQLSSEEAASRERTVESLVNVA